MTRAPRDLAMLEQQADARLAELGAIMADQLPALTSALFDRLEDKIEELRGDQIILDLLEASTGSNLDNVVHLLRGHVRIDDLRIPSAAEEYARRLAQRGIASNALARAYRLGHRMVLEWGHDRLSTDEPDPEVAAIAAKKLMQITFDYIDIIAEAAVNAYESERERWLANRNSVRLEVLEALLSDRSTDIARAEAALGYRLRQHHLGVLLWNASATSSTADLRQLETLLSQLSRALGGSATPLFVPRDRATGWGWVSLGRQATEVDAEAIQGVMANAPAGVHLAMGTPAPGEAGFRKTHHEAVRAQNVALVAKTQARQVTAYADAFVRTAALLATDLDSTRTLVATTLGPLSLDDESTERMRETLLTFLTERNSYAATAAKMHVHKNTVRYRVERAIEARGKALDEDRLDLELALIACEMLGSEVLSISPD